MRVLVWKSYGAVKVFQAETPLQFFKIYEDLKIRMTGWREDAALKKLFKNMGIVTSSLGCELLFTNFVKPHLNTHELFETFEFTTSL